MGRYNRCKKKKKREKKDNVTSTKPTCYWVPRVPMPIGPKEKFKNHTKRYFWTCVAYGLWGFFISFLIFTIMEFLHESGQPTPTP